MTSFETLYLNLWKNSIDEAKNGLKGYLLRKKDNEYIFDINYDEK